MRPPTLLQYAWWLSSVGHCTASGRSIQIQAVSEDRNLSSGDHSQNLIRQLLSGCFQTPDLIRYGHQHHHRSLSDGHPNTGNWNHSPVFLRIC